MQMQSQALAISDDPLAVFGGLVDDHNYCFLLETLADKYQPQTSGQSYIGVAPTHVYAAENNQFYADGKQLSGENAYHQLAEVLPIDTSLEAGYVGGLVGYFSHEGIQYLEPSLSLPYARRFKDFEFGEYQDGLIFRKDQKPTYFYQNEDRSALYKPAPVSQVEPLHIRYLGRNKTSAAYDEMITSARDDIQNGRVFQVVLSDQFEYEYTGQLLDLYRELRRINPSPFMFFMKFGDTITMGASPELLAHTNPERRAYLEALAGTIRRGKDDTEDELLAQQLLADEKEIAEHSMLVDLARNDVGRISKIGSVQIDDLMYIKKLSHVQHISSIVSGELAEGKTAFDALAASFPAGTLSGAPKIEAIKMIAELEGAERGPYGGTIGYFSYSGDSVHAVNIRSLSSFQNKLFLNSGSGVVYDSRAEREYQEVNEKKAAMDRAMEPFLEAEQ